MGIMKLLDELEQELYENGKIELDKDNWEAPIVKSWFSNTMKPEDYSGIFEGISLKIYETKTKLIIEYDKNDVESVYKSSMNGMKKELTNIIDLLGGDIYGK